MNDSKLATLPTQTLMQRLTRELDDWTAIPFDVQAIANDSYIRERLALLSSSRF